MTICEAAKLMKMNAQGLRIHLQKGHLAEFGMAIPNLTGTGYRYLLYEDAIREKFKGDDKK